MGYDGGQACLDDYSTIYGVWTEGGSTVNMPDCSTYPSRQRGDCMGDSVVISYTISMVGLLYSQYQMYYSVEANPNAYFSLEFISPTYPSNLQFTMFA
jgi:hypothetical protein